MSGKSIFQSQAQFVGQYLEQLLNARVWVDRADEMLEASKLLELQIREYWSVVIAGMRKRKPGELCSVTVRCDLHGPYFILVSYGLENLFKAIIVGERGDEIRRQFARKGRLPDLIKGHDLVKLSRNANIEMGSEEENVLFRLSRFSKWRGRYPVPVEVCDMGSVVPDSDGKPTLTDYYAPGDVDQISAIVEKTRGHVANYVKGAS